MVYSHVDRVPALSTWGKYSPVRFPPSCLSCASGLTTPVAQTTSGAVPIYGLLPLKARNSHLPPFSMDLRFGYDGVTQARQPRRLPRLFFFFLDFLFQDFGLPHRWRPLRWFLCDMKSRRMVSAVPSCLGWCLDRITVTTTYFYPILLRLPHARGPHHLSF